MWVQHSFSGQLFKAVVLDSVVEVKLNATAKEINQKLEQNINVHL